MSLSSSKFYYWLDNHTPFMSSNHTYELFFFCLVKNKYPLHFSESEVCSEAKTSRSHHWACLANLRVALFPIGHKHN